ncbi:MAG: hypothetical protein GXP27_05765 [Planctomycetes bacterium]|nr:hypothetical protein [Planctomycetota bacterium]
MPRRWAVLAGLLRWAFYCGALAAALELVWFYAPNPVIETQVDQEAHHNWKSYWFVHQLITGVTASSLLGGLAGIASNCGPRPLPFMRCLAIIFLSTAAALLATDPTGK